jgi:5-methyltetrahydrofolate--homocysteine methyltransferase
VFDDYPLADLVDIIDWTPFFNTWELAGKYPTILKDDVVGAQARELFKDAQAMLKRIVDEKWLTAKGVVGLWPGEQHWRRRRCRCRRRRDHSALPAPAGRQAHRPPRFLPRRLHRTTESGKQGLDRRLAVTSGLGIEPHVARFEADHDDYNAIMLKALADRLAERSPSACTSACARSSGATPPARRSTTTR